MNPRDIFLKSLRREEVPRPATGSATSMVTVDLMDEAGAAFPEAHRDAALMARLAAAGHTVIGFDNIMPLFSVWHESAALGCPVNWGARDRMPDCQGALYEIENDITIPGDLLTHDAIRVPLEAIRILKKEYGDEAAIVGKVFGPWTLGYHMFGVEDFLINTILKPDAVRKAMASLQKVTLMFAAAQIEAGADALCLADHATRDLCSPETYRDFLRDTHAELAAAIPCPLILHICGDTADRIPYIAETGIDCFHFDSKVDAQEARRLAGDKLALMGGTSNFDIIRSGTADAVKADVRAKQKAHIDIIGPECAVPLDAPSENMRILAAAVKTGL